MNSPRLRAKGFSPCSVSRNNSHRRAMNRKWSVTIVGRLFRDDHAARRRLSSYLFSAKGRRWILVVRIRVLVFLSLSLPRPSLPLPVTTHPTCCSPRWRTDKLSAAVAGTAILSYPFSFYRIIYHQRSHSLLHSARRPGATALDRPVPHDLSLSCSRLQVSRRYEFLRSIAIRSFSFISHQRWKFHYRRGGCRGAHSPRV